MSVIRPDLEYLSYLEQGRFCIQRSRSSGNYVFYPRTIAPGSGADDLEWVDAVGEGSVYSTTIVRAKPPMLDYNVAIIQLKEGPRMMSRVESAAPSDVHIDMKVRARIHRPEGDSPYVVFDPV